MFKGENGILLYVSTLISIFIICGKDLVRLALNTVSLMIDCFQNLCLFIKKVFSDSDIIYKRIINSSYRKLACLSLVSFLPMAIIATIGTQIVNSASKSILIIGVVLLTEGTVCLIADALPKGIKTPKHITYGEALIVGLCQSVGLIAGISGIVVTYTMSVYLGFRKDMAIRYSMILAMQTAFVGILIKLSDYNITNVTPEGIVKGLATLVGITFLCFICIRIIQLTIQKDKIKYLAYICYGTGICAVLLSVLK